jgi:hypothetical protein
MPEFGEVDGDGGMLTDPVFYQWYQGAWIGRLRTLSTAVLEAGLKHIWTWWVPLTYLTGETLAMGTFRSVSPLHLWQRDLKEAGADPVLVAACLFPHGELVRGTIIDIVRQCKNKHGWSVIGGVEASCDATVAVQNIKKHLAVAPDCGLDGVFVSDRNLRAPEQVFSLFRGTPCRSTRGPG